MPALKKIACAVMFAFVWGLTTQCQQSSCEIHTLIVNVRDKRGGFVPSLRASDFRVKLHGGQISIVSADSGTGVRRVVLAIDVSGSMSVIHQGVVGMVSEIFRTFPDGTQFALVIFSDRIVETVQLSHSRQEVLGVVSRVAGSHGKRTALNDSLLYAAGLLGTGERGDSVVVISDGGDNLSKTSSDKLGAAYLARGIRLSAIMPLVHDFQTEEEKQGLSDLQGAATATGGAVRVIQGPNQVGNVGDLADELGHYYVLQISTPGLEKRSHWQPEVVDRSGRQRKDLKLSFPPDIAPACAGS
jgi:von Willebrand factor type A domain